MLTRLSCVQRTPSFILARLLAWRSSQEPHKRPLQSEVSQSHTGPPPPRAVLWRESFAPFGCVSQLLALKAALLT